MIFFDAYIKYLEHLKNRKYDPPITTESTGGAELTLPITFSWDGNPEGRAVAPMIISGEHGVDCLFYHVSDTEMARMSGIHNLNISELVMGEYDRNYSINYEIISYSLEELLGIPDVYIVEIPGLLLSVSEDFTFYEEGEDGESFSITFKKGTYLAMGSKYIVLGNDMPEGFFDYIALSVTISEV